MELVNDKGLHHYVQAFTIPLLENEMGLTIRNFVKALGQFTFNEI
jgi:hypothetical protein